MSRVHIGKTSVRCRDQGFASFGKKSVAEHPCKNPLVYQTAKILLFLFLLHTTAMAPNRGSSKSTRGIKSGSSRGGTSGNSAGRKPTGVSKSRTSNKTSLPPPKQQKTMSASSKLKNGARKKHRVYTAKELGLPKLNMITPVGVEAPRGKKRGKVFVDDPVSNASSMEGFVFKCQLASLGQLHRNGYSWQKWS